MQNLIPSRAEERTALTQRPQLVYLEPAVGESESASPDQKGLLEYWSLLGDHKILMLTLVALGASGGLTIGLHETPVYQARASLEIHNSISRSPLTGGLDSEENGSPESYLQTQVKILQSTKLRNRTLARLGEVSADRDYIVADRYAVLRRYAGDRFPPALKSKRMPAVKVDVKTTGAARVVEAFAQTTDASLAADFINTLSQEYLDYTMESRWEASRRTGKWLGDQLAEQRNKLEDSQRRLQDYSRTAGFLSPGKDPDTIDDDTLRRLQEELARAQAERVTKQAIYETAAGVPADSVPLVADNDRLGGYLTRLTELRRELAEISSVWKPEHYRVVRVRAQIDELESTIKRERESILTRIHNDFESASRRERMLRDAHDARLKTVMENSGQLIRYSILKREVETNRTLYDQLLQKVREVGIGSQMESSSASVLDTAEIPLIPISPNLPAIVLLGAMTGFIGALILIFLSDHVNRSLTAPGQCPYYLNVPELGVIPSRQAVPSSLESRRGSLMALAEPAIKPAEAVGLLTWRDRPSPIAESFRNALVSILMTRGRPKVILITSPNREEGKSTTVTNLGAALAEINQRVLVIDADLRQPHLHEILNVPNSWGLSDLLHEKMRLADCPLEALVRPTEVSNLWVLPAGPGTISIANLLCSTRMTELVNRFRSEFDSVIIDTPPMLYLSDARLLGSLSDAAILVIRAGRTTRDDAMAAKQRLVEDGIKVLGTILNDWNFRDKGRYGSRRYNYGYGDHD